MKQALKPTFLTFGDSAETSSQRSQPAWQAGRLRVVKSNQYSRPETVAHLHVGTWQPAADSLGKAGEKRNETEIPAELGRSEQIPISAKRTLPLS